MSLIYRLQKEYFIDGVSKIPDLHKESKRKGGLAQLVRALA